ncbi:overexpressed in colon carcinoma 1 protein isoform X5 [Stegostoma tigrinum]|uniref:overexpressed in colon carcinoma 1 protein isoform X5 n=1 Tax=Stegostoma tigrinum TaxID=3053191 RepID=UPI00202B4FBE|nr:overexpressed in colon carcinoma 1 protein isoform X5 [Stegostoma tigrinum]
MRSLKSDLSKSALLSEESTSEDEKRRIIFLRDTEPKELRRCLRWFACRYCHQGSQSHSYNWQSVYKLKPRPGQCLSLLSTIVLAEWHSF